MVLIKITHKIDIVKSLAIIIASGNDTAKVMGFKATRENNVFFFTMIFQGLEISTMCVEIFTKMLTFTGTSIMTKQKNKKRNNGKITHTNKQANKQINKRTKKQ